jgi:murein DD-endopeptidase MepM/ murein hydrolase activator NlpD
MRKFNLLIALLIFVTAGTLIVNIVGCNRGDSANEESTRTAEAVEPTILFDVEVDTLEVFSGQVMRNQFLSDILLSFGVDYVTIDHIARHRQDIFDVRRIRAGNDYTIIAAADSINTPLYFAYEINNTEYVVFGLYDTLPSWRGRKEIERRIESAYGNIKSSLWNAMVGGGFDPNLANNLSEVYAWTIDFFGIQKGDQFEVIYERLYVENRPIGIGRVLSARFNHYGKDHYAFYFEQDSVGDYFDEHGQSLMRTFLKAPLKYSRISSGFSHSRYHPILKYHRPHHGVDYAAPEGTPVFAIGEGVVTRKGFQAGGAGNYLYIKHNSTYTTAYMHLRNFAKGINQGSRVSQGQVIGYVGKTGLATGPHLDFRFFRNGHPVNPLTVESPPAKPVDTTYMELYLGVVNEMRHALDKVLISRSLAELEERESDDESGGGTSL